MEEQEEQGGFVGWEESVLFPPERWGSNAALQLLGDTRALRDYINSALLGSHVNNNTL